MQKLIVAITATIALYSVALAGPPVGKVHLLPNAMFADSKESFDKALHLMNQGDQESLKELILAGHVGAVDQNTACFVDGSGGLGLTKFHFPGKASSTFYVADEYIASDLK